MISLFASKGQFEMDLTQPFRLIFEKKQDTIELVKVIEIEDYH